MRAIYVESVPILFDALEVADGKPKDPRVVEALDEAFPERWRDDDWAGDYPLTGHMLIASLSLCEQLEEPFRVRGLRP